MLKLATLKNDSFKQLHHFLNIRDNNKELLFRAAELCTFLTLYLPFISQSSLVMRCPELIIRFYIKANSGLFQWIVPTKTITMHPVLYSAAGVGVPVRLDMRLSKRSYFIYLFLMNEYLSIQTSVPMPNKNNHLLNSYFLLWFSHSCIVKGVLG